MAKLPQFDAGVIGATPNSLGTDATAQTARRVGAFYNQVAAGTDTLARATERLANETQGLGREMGQFGRETAQFGQETRQLGRETGELGDFTGRAETAAGRAIGSGIDAAGSAAIKMEDHREISHGAATYSQMFDDLTQSWNDTVKNSDPNDPSVAAKWREEQLEPRLEQFRGGFNTERSQQWADAKVAATREHMFEKSAADMSTMAGVAVKNNIATQASQMTNTAMNDPSSVPFLLGNVDHSIGGMVDTSPNIRGVDAVKLKTDVGEATKAAIVKYGAMGAIQKSANPEATAEEWIKKYPDYLSGADAKNLAQNARSQIRARNYDDNMNRRRAKEEAQDRSDEAANQYLIDIRSKDPRLASDPTAAKVLNDPSLSRTDKNNLLNYIDRQNKPETDARTSQATFVGLLRQMRDPDADPDKLMQSAWDARLTDPGKPGSLSERDFNQFRNEIAARKTPDGAALEKDRGEFFKRYASTVDPGMSMGIHSALGDQRMYAFEMEARRQEQFLRSKQQDPHSLYDPASPNFIGKQIGKYQTSMEEANAYEASLRKKPANTNLSAPGTEITGVSVENKFAPPPNWQYSASRGQYRDPQGRIYDKNGKLIERNAAPVQ